jgi:hypothetical protein
VIRFHFPSAATVSSLDAVDTDWLVGSGDGTVFRLIRQTERLVPDLVAPGHTFTVAREARSRKLLVSGSFFRYGVAGSPFGIRRGFEPPRVARPAPREKGSA